MSNFLGSFCIGGTEFFWGERGTRPFSSIKPSMTNHVNSRMVAGKIMCESCVHANFSHFYLGIFSLRIFCQFECPLILSKKCLLLFGNNSVKVWILFDMTS